MTEVGTAVKVEVPYLSEEPDRHGNVRLYVRRYGRRIRLRSPVGSKGFTAAISRGPGSSFRSDPASNHQPNQENRPAGLSGLARRPLFWGRKSFRGLDPKSLSTRRGIIEDCLRMIRDGSSDAMADCPLSFVTSAKVKRLRDLKNDLPGAANNRRKYISAMFGWAIETTPHDDHQSGARRAPDQIRHRRASTPGLPMRSRQFVERHPIGTKARWRSPSCCLRACGVATW